MIEVLMMCNTYSIYIHEGYKKKPVKTISIETIGDIARLINEYKIEINDVFKKEDYEYCLCGISLNVIDTILGKISRIEVDNFKEVKISW